MITTDIELKGIRTQERLLYEAVYDGPLVVDTKDGIVLCSGWFLSNLLNVQFDKAYPDVKYLPSCIGVSPDLETIQRKIVRPLRKEVETYVVEAVHVPKVPGEKGGWRWHKWGVFIGDGEQPTTEYLADEVGFDNGVYTYHYMELG